jgi:hypothetical protein
MGRAYPRTFARSEELIDPQQAFLLKFADVKGMSPSELVVVAAKLLSAADDDDIAAADWRFDKVVVALAGKFPKAVGVFDVPLDAGRVAVLSCQHMGGGEIRHACISAKPNAAVGQFDGVGGVVLGNDALEGAQQAIDVPLPTEMPLELARGKHDLMERDAEAPRDELKKAPLDELAPLGVADGSLRNAAARGEFELRQSQRTAEAGELGAIGLQRGHRIDPQVQRDAARDAK